MNEVSLWVEQATASIARLMGQFIEYLPTLLGVFAILVIGWIVASLLRRLTRRMLLGFNSVVERNVDWGAARGMRLTASSTHLIASTIYWIVLLFFVTVATGMLGLDAFSLWLTKIVEYLPAAIAGIAIIVVGFIAGGWVREAVVVSADAAGIVQSANLGRMAQSIVIVAATVLGIKQVGIDTDLLVSIINITLAAFLGGMALAFGLGSRDLVANLIGAHHAARQFGPGDRLSIDDIEGVVTQVTPTYLMVESKTGTVQIPGRLFQQKAFIIVGGKNDD